MKMDDVKKIAAELGIKAGKLRKADLIQQIQQAEGNDPCYATANLQSAVRMSVSGATTAFDQNEQQ